MVANKRLYFLESSCFVVAVVVAIYAGSVQTIKRNKVLSFDAYLTKPYQYSVAHVN